MNLKIKVTDASAKLLSSQGVLTTGMVGATVEFVFDDAWDALRKIAVFRAGLAVKEVDGIDTLVEIPVEVLQEAKQILEVGVYGYNESGELVIPTVYVKACTIHEGADPIGNISTSLPIYARLQKSINDLRNILVETKESFVSKLNDICQTYLPIKGGKITGSLLTRDIRVGGDIDESTGKWEPAAGKGKSSLRVSGTTELHGEVYAEDSSFHVKAIDVENEARIKGSLTVDNKTRIKNSLRVDSELQCDGRLKLKSDLDMKGNDIRHVQSIQVEGTLNSSGDVKIKNNTNRDYTLKLSDVLNEALDYRFKSRVYVDKMDGDNFTEQLKNAIEAVDDGGVVCIPSGEYDIELTGNDYIGIDKNITILGIGKKRPILKIIAERERAAIFQITPSGYADQTSVQVENVNFDCQTECELFRCVSDTGPIDFQLLDCDITGRDAFITTFSARNFRVERCHFDAYTHIQTTYEEWSYCHQESVEIVDSDIYGHLYSQYSVGKILIQGSAINSDDARKYYGTSSTPMCYPKVSYVQIINSTLSQYLDEGIESMVISKIDTLYIDRSYVPCICFDHIDSAYVTNSTSYSSIFRCSTYSPDEAYGIDRCVMLGNSSQNMLIKSGKARVVTDADVYTKEEIDQMLGSVEQTLAAI